MGTHVVTIAGWHPALVNELMRHDRKVSHRIKKASMARILEECVIQGVPLVSWPTSFLKQCRDMGLDPDRVPDAPTPRRRLVKVELHSPRFKHKHQTPDPDAPFKTTLDGLKHAGVIVDDREDWCEWEPAIFEVGPKATVILIKDL